MNYERMLNSIANQRVWMPAIIKANGQVENMTQAYVTTRGAGKGETNYKTRKRPTKYGQFKTEQGTFVANKHIEVEILRTNEIDVDARIIRLGRNVRATMADGWDGILAQACKEAALALSSRTTRSENTEADSEEIQK